MSWKSGAADGGQKSLLTLMDKRILELLTKVKQGALPVEEAYDALKAVYTK